MSTASSSTLPWPSGAPAALHWGREGAGGGVSWMLRRCGAVDGRHLLAAHAVLCALALGLASLWWPSGAAVVLPLVWFELMVLGVALWAWARRAADRECIALAGDRLTVECIHGRHVDRVEFQSAWVRVEPEHGEGSLIELSGQGRRVTVGRYLLPVQRPRLAEELRTALRRRHPGAAKPASK